MANIFCLLVLCLSAVAGLPTQQRIINGSLTTIDRYPFMAAVMLSTDVGYRHICGGTIINNRSVLSAAHCFYDSISRQIGIRVGSTFTSYGGDFHFASALISYPDYNPVSYFHDIGIVRVMTAFSFGPNIQVGRIAGPNYNPGDDQPVWVAGWGLTSAPPTGVSSDELRHVQIHTVNQSVCARDFYGSQLQPFMLCAGGNNRGPCTGDSGGPLVQNNAIIGVTSFTAIPCGVPPAVYARVSSHSEWIINNA